MPSLTTSERRHRGARQAVIAVSGGSTPARFFTKLGKRKDIDWEQGLRHARRRALGPRNLRPLQRRLVNEKMLQGPAAVGAVRAALCRRRTSPTASALKQTAKALAALPRRSMR
jgi:6-phosphogluconolactonase